MHLHSILTPSVWYWSCLITTSGRESWPTHHGIRHRISNSYLYCFDATYHRVRYSSLCNTGGKFGGEKVFDSTESLSDAHLNGVWSSERDSAFCIPSFSETRIALESPTLAIHAVFPRKRQEIAVVPLISSPTPAWWSWSFVHVIAWCKACSGFVDNPGCSNAFSGTWVQT